MDNKQIDVMVADASHEVYVDKILETIKEAAKVRGTGIAERTHEYVATKMKEGKAIIALCGDEFAGFTYIESWGNKQYVATSGLIVHPNFRGVGLAKRIKTASVSRKSCGNDRNACYRREIVRKIRHSLFERFSVVQTFTENDLAMELASAVSKLL